MVGATYHFTRHCREARRVLRSGGDAGQPSVQRGGHPRQDALREDDCELRVHGTGGVLEQELSEGR